MQEVSSQTSCPSGSWDPSAVLLSAPASHAKATPGVDGRQGRRAEVPSTPLCGPVAPVGVLGVHSEQATPPLSFLDMPGIATGGHSRRSEHSPAASMASPFSFLDEPSIAAGERSRRAEHSSPHCVPLQYTASGLVETLPPARSLPSFMGSPSGGDAGRSQWTGYSLGAFNCLRTQEAKEFTKMI